MHVPLLVLLFATSALAALPYKGIDWSSALQVERSGKTYKNAAGQVQPVEKLLKDVGVNTVRQRIWVNPSGGDYNLDYNVRLAKRAQAAGLKVYLDFHYSDSWADPGKQVTPAAWNKLSKDALIQKVYDYTKGAMDLMQQNGIEVALVSIGNEIRPGLLHPIGRLSNSDGPRTVSQLLKSASKAIKESSLTKQPKIMIHIDNGWNWGTQQSWYDRVLGSNGGLTAADYDVQGVSYYPFYNTDARLSSLATSLNNMAKRYGKEVQVVETNWPVSCPNPSRAFPADAREIPFSVAGQTQWMKKVADIVEAVPNGLGTGFFIWEPLWQGPGGLGSSCADNLMVERDGRLRASMNVFQGI